MKQTKFQTFVKKWGMTVALALLIPFIVFTLVALFSQKPPVYYTTIAFALISFLTSLSLQILHKKFTAAEKKEELPPITEPQEETTEPPVLEEKKEEETETPVQKENKEEPVIEPETDTKPIPGSKALLQYDDQGNLIHRYESVNEAERITGINSKSLRDCAYGRQKHAGGFVWKYEENKKNNKKELQ